LCAVIAEAIAAVAVAIVCPVEVPRSASRLRLFPRRRSGSVGKWKKENNRKKRRALAVTIERLRRYTTQTQ